MIRLRSPDPLSPKIKNNGERPDLNNNDYLRNNYESMDWWRAGKKYS